jgi:nitroreductase
MTVKTAIKKRRSIRKYQTKKVPSKLIRDLIDCARLAPSGNNTQPSRFLIVTDEKTKKKLKENKIFDQDFIYQAPVILVCCTSPQAYKKRLVDWDATNDIRATRDLSIACSFLVLRATELGLGTCFIGWIKRKEIKKILGIPNHFFIPYAITIGYPAENPKARARKKLGEIIL